MGCSRAEQVFQGALQMLLAFSADIWDVWPALVNRD